MELYDTDTTRLPLQCIYDIYDIYGGIPVQAKGVRMIDTKPRYGAGGASIAFVHPKSSYGVLVELCQHK